MPRPRPAYVEDTTLTDELPDLLTVREAAELLTISVARVRHLQASRYIPFYKIGGSVRFAQSDLVAYLAKQRIEAIGTKR